MVEPSNRSQFMQSAAERQRKMAAKAARRKNVLAEKAKLVQPKVSLPNQIKAAAKGRLLHCLVPSGLFQMGSGNIFVVRSLPSGLFGCAIFLIDALCLGVKSAIYHELSKQQLLDRIGEFSEHEDFNEVDPAYARKLVRDARLYADGLGLTGLGLPSAANTSVIEGIFGDVDADMCQDVFVFGVDGKPLYRNGPYEKTPQIRAILAALEKSCGVGGWNHVLRVHEGIEDLFVAK